MNKEAVIQRVKNVLMIPVMVIGNILVWGGLNIILFGWLIAKIISGESSIGVYELFGGLIAILIGGYLNYLYWFKYKSFKKTEKRIKNLMSAENSSDNKTNQPKNMSFWKRLTWGFLPEGWRRVMIILILLMPLVLNGFELDSRGEFEDFLANITVCIPIGSISSLIISWIYDGFKKQ